MQTAVEELTMVFSRISDDDTPGEDRDDIVGGGSIPDPDAKGAGFDLGEDPEAPESLEDKIEDELGDEDSDAEPDAM